MKSFFEYHPSVIFGYFLSVILTTMIQVHPVFLILSTLFAFIYCIDLKVMSKSYLKFIIIFYLIVAISNPLFVHDGATILFYIQYTPITLEAIIYGFVFSTLIISLLNWFKIINIGLDSEKIIYLFKNKLPTVGLILSMVLGMMPRFFKQTKQIVETQKTLGKDISKGNILKRIKIGFDILLILFTWAFESSLTTLKSMHARGYGHKQRSHFHTYVFEQRDMLAMIILIVLNVIFIFGFITRFSSFYYYPVVKVVQVKALDVLYYISYILLMGLPYLLKKGVGDYVDI
ncbi:MAG: energy-coupling factor transporter transmembrane component T [Coprobacillus sp.]